MAELLFDRPAATLGQACVRVRQAAGSVDVLMSPEWQEFLFHSLNKVALSSASIECMFSSFSQWKIDSMGLLQSRHVCSCFQEACARKKRLLREGEDPERLASLSKRGSKRPEWVFKRGELGQHNAFHIFTAERVRDRPVGVTQHAAFSSAARAWREANALEKAQARRKAKATRTTSVTLKKNRLQQVNVQEEMPSPWNIARGATTHCMLRTWRQSGACAMGLL